MGLLVFGGACDFNDVDDSGSFKLYVSALVDGEAWESVSGVSAGLDTSGAEPTVVIRGDTSDPYESLTIRFAHLMVSEPGAPGMGDATVDGTDLAGAIEFSDATTGLWISTTGNLEIHEYAINSKHEYSGVFSGTLQSEVDGATMEVADGEYVVQAMSY